MKPIADRTYLQDLLERLKNRRMWNRLFLRRLLLKQA